MKVRKIMLVLLAVLGGCGVEGEEPAVTSQREALKTLLPAPYVPATPTAWVRGKTSLYPTRIKSAYTIIYASDTNPKEFYAWGFDVVNRECVFHVRGPMSSVADFEDDIKGALQLVAAHNPTYVGSGGQGQIKVPRGPGPGGNDRWAEALFNSQF